MGLSQSLFSAISGLINHQTRMDNIGNNLSNVNTVGFKKGVMLFSDLLSQTIRSGSIGSTSEGRAGINPIQIGLCTQTATIVQDFSQGGLETTGNPYDLAINGEGFFILGQGATNDIIRYTRDGSFRLDANDMLIASNGYRVLGVEEDEDGSLPAISDINSLGTITIDKGTTIPGNVTSEITLGGNLNAAGSVATTGTRTFSDQMFTQVNDGSDIYLSAGTGAAGTDTITGVRDVTGLQIGDQIYLSGGGLTPGLYTVAFFTNDGDATTAETITISTGPTFPIPANATGVTVRIPVTQSTDLRSYANTSSVTVAGGVVTNGGAATPPFRITGAAGAFTGIVEGDWVELTAAAGGTVTNGNYEVISVSNTGNTIDLATDAGTAGTATVKRINYDDTQTQSTGTMGGVYNEDGDLLFSDWNHETNPLPSLELSAKKGDTRITETFHYGDPTVAPAAGSDFEMYNGTSLTNFMTWAEEILGISSSGAFPYITDDVGRSKVGDDDGVKDSDAYNETRVAFGRTSAFRNVLSGNRADATLAAGNSQIDMWESSSLDAVDFTTLMADDGSDYVYAYGASVTDGVYQVLAGSAGVGTFTLVGDVGVPLTDDVNWEYLGSFAAAPVDLADARATAGQNSSGSAATLTSTIPAAVMGTTSDVYFRDGAVLDGGVAGRFLNVAQKDEIYLSGGGVTTGYYTVQYVSTNGRYVVFGDGDADTTEFTNVDFDSDNYDFNSAGTNALTGISWEVNPNRMYINGNLGEANAITDVKFTSGGTTINPFENGELASADGESARTTIVVYDSLGNAHNLDVVMTLMDREDEKAMWRWYAVSRDNTTLHRYAPLNPPPLERIETDTNNTESVVGWGDVWFKKDGTFDREELIPNQTGFPEVIIDLVDLGVDTPLRIDPIFSSLSQTAGTRSKVYLENQDGYDAGDLQDFSVGNDGKVYGAFSNGITRVIAQIALARFNNVNGLEKVGVNLFKEGVNSGGAVPGTAGDSGFGFIESGKLELSNVDLSEEFTNLIITQRGFQANARVITTSDEMLVELTNMKRA